MWCARTAGDGGMDVSAERGESTNDLNKEEYQEPP